MILDQSAIVRLAIHEAGHAIVGRQFGWSICCIHLEPGLDYRRTSFLKPEKQREQDHIVKVALAGTVAEELFNGGAEGKWEDDEETARAAIKRIWPDDPSAWKKQLPQLKVQVGNLLNEAAVIAVKDAFITSGRLFVRGDHVERVIDEATNR